jgi:valyl-tRNA synthetase
VTEGLADCGFSEASEGLYRFIWNQFCDWYVELAKPLLTGEDNEAKSETQATAAWALDVILTLLHPVMPFLTEELWAQTADLGAPRAHVGFLMTAPWPDLPEQLINPAADAEIGLVIEAISEGRSVRAGLNVPLSARPPLMLIEADPDQRRVLLANAAQVERLLRVSGVESVDAPPPGAIPFMVAGATLALPVAEFIDLAAERARLAKEVGGLEGEIRKIGGKLGNPDFVARAPEEVVEENRERLVEAEAARDKLHGALLRLQGVK